MIGLNPLGKIVMAALCAGDRVWLCNTNDMAAGKQPECTKAGNKRFKYAFTMYVSLLLPPLMPFPPQLTLVSSHLSSFRLFSVSQGNLLLNSS